MNVAVGRPVYPGLIEVEPTLDPDRYEVCGSDMQVLSLKLDAAERIESVPGALSYMEPGVKMNVNCNDCLPRCISGSSCST